MKNVPTSNPDLSLSDILKDTEVVEFKDLVSFTSETPQFVNPNNKLVKFKGTLVKNESTKTRFGFMLQDKFVAVVMMVCNRQNKEITLSEEILQTQEKSDSAISFVGARMGNEMFIFAFYV